MLSSAVVTSRPSRRSTSRHNPRLPTSLAVCGAGSDVERQASRPLEKAHDLDWFPAVQRSPRLLGGEGEVYGELSLHAGPCAAPILEVEGPLVAPLLQVPIDPAPQLVPALDVLEGDEAEPGGHLTLRVDIVHAGEHSPHVEGAMALDDELGHDIGLVADGHELLVPSDLTPPPGRGAGKHADVPLRHGPFLPFGLINRWLFTPRSSAGRTTRRTAPRTSPSSSADPGWRWRWRGWPGRSCTPPCPRG